VSDLPVDPDLAITGRRDRAIVIAIALGAMPGAAARYGISRAVTSAPDGFPWATFSTNISGSLVLGALVAWLVVRFPADRFVRPFAGIGFLGAYTTFSTFSVEADLLVKDGHALTAGVYVVASLVVGIGAAWVGVAGARALASR
jgi:fluoride exporter